MGAESLRHRYRSCRQSGRCVSHRYSCAFAAPRRLRVTFFQQEQVLVVFEGRISRRLLFGMTIALLQGLPRPLFFHFYRYFPSLDPFSLLFYTYNAILSTGTGLVTALPGERCCAALLPATFTIARHGNKAFNDALVFPPEVSLEEVTTFFADFFPNTHPVVEGVGGEEGRIARHKAHNDPRVVHIQPVGLDFPARRNKRASKGEEGMRKWLKYRGGPSCR